MVSDIGSSCEINHLVTCFWHLSAQGLKHSLTVYSCTLLSVFLSFSVIFSFTVGVVFNLTLHCSHPFYLSFHLLSLFPLVFLSQLHGNLFPYRSGWCSLTFSFLKQLAKTPQKQVFFPVFTHNSCQTKHIFEVAILRYNLAETPIYKPSLHACEPVFHTCQTKLISSSLFPLPRSEPYEIQQEEQQLGSFYWTPHTAAQLKDIQQGRGELNRLMYLPRLGCGGGTWLADLWDASQEHQSL